MSEQNQAIPARKMLSPLDAWAMAFGCMVGWGSFVMPGSTFLPLAGPAGTVIAMAISLAVMLVIGSCFSFLMTRSPGTDGIYAYAKKAFGWDHAFLCSWFLCLSYLTILFLNGTALFLVIRTLLGDIASRGYHYTIAGNPVYLNEVILSVVALAGAGGLFLVAKDALRRLSTLLAVILFAGVAFIALRCLPGALPRNLLGTFGYQDVNKGFAIFSLIILAPWAFVGFEVVSLETARFRFPVQKTGRVIIASIITAALTYVALTLVSASLVPDGYGSWQAYIADLDNLHGISALPTFHVARKTMGTAGLAIAAITAMAAILTGLIGAYRALIRMLSTMAEDKILSKKFTRASYSILFVMLLSILIALLGRNTLIWFVDLTSFGAVVAYGYTTAAAYKTAKAEGNRRIMVTSLLGVCISVLFGVVQIVPGLVILDTMSCEAFLLLSLWCLLGFMFYWHIIRRRSQTEFGGISTSGMILFALLVYTAIMWMGKLLMEEKTLANVHTTIRVGGGGLLLIIFIGLAVMLYIQNLIRQMHEKAERERIRATEGELARSQFLFNMSHDIRTPMNAIVGYTTLALKEPDDMLRGYLVKIDKSSKQLLTLLNDILEMSRLENGKLELKYSPTDLSLIFEEVGEILAGQMRQKRLDFTIHAAQLRHRYVWCDKKNLNRVIMNILSNAYKFTPAGGRISASVAEIGSDDNGYGAYEMHFRDNGIGMSKEFAAKMFHAFERERTSTESGVEGTGLGLAITKSIVSQMGGAIDVITAPGSGTEFIIRIKFRFASESDMAREQDAERAAAPPAVSFEGKRLLLVEDNAINLEIAQMLLEQLGFAVETAENGQVAVAKVKASRPGHYDAVLMDIQMPVMDGYAATKAIRALPAPELAGLPILAMTANAFDEDIQAAKAAGMQSHIAKPIDVNALKRELARVLMKN